MTTDPSSAGSAPDRDPGPAAGAEKPSRRDVDAIGRLRAFTERHGAGCVAVINYVGRVGTRIVVIAPSGEFGDVLVGAPADAVAVCEELNVAVRDWDRETTGLLAPSTHDRVLMGTRRH